MSREENMITILIPDPTFSWQQQSVSLETNLEACEQCGPGLLISADTGSHYPGPGVKPKTAHANPEKGGSAAQALLLVWSERSLSESHYSSQMDGCDPALCAFAKSGCWHHLTVVIFSYWLYTSRFLRSLWSQPRVRTWRVKLQIIIDAFRLRL